MLGTSESVFEESVSIPGADRVLEGVLAYPRDREPDFGALIAGPHPFLGGGLENNIVGALVKAMARSGAVGLAFNYAGVGRSEGGPVDWPGVMSAFWREGCFAEEEDWVEDVGSAMRALVSWSGGGVVLMGYSFGCWTLCRHLKESDVRAVVLISPNPTGPHKVDPIRAPDVPLLVVHSDNDFTCGVETVSAWFETLGEPKERVLLQAGEHFFRGHEPEVVQATLGFLRRCRIMRAS